MFLLKNPWAMELGKTKEGLTTLFHLYVVSVSLLMPIHLGQCCCHQNEQRIWLENNLETKNKVFNYFAWLVVLITSDVGEVMGVGHHDGGWSGSASFGSDFLLHLLKPTEKLSQETSLLFSSLEMNPEGSALMCNQAVLNILAAIRATNWVM